MALKRSGLELVADGASAFYRDLDRADAAVVDFGRNATRASSGVDTLGKSADKAETHVGKLGQIATGAARQLGSLAVDGALRLAASVASIGPATVSAAADFEQGMDNIGAVAGATAEEMQQISDLALQLGKDTSFSASQASAGIEELIKGGVSIADVMDGAAEATLNLAAAGGVELADAAEIGANALAIFNLKGSDMAMVADRIAGAANASSLSVTDFKFSMAAAGSVMAATGQNFDDLATSIAILGANGIKGSDAGTSLKTMFMNLQPQTKAQVAAFRELNLLTEDGVNAFINLDGSFKSAAEVAGILQTATKDLTEAQRIQKLETIFGSDAVRAATIFVKEGAAGFDTMAESMGKVTAASVAAERLDNLRGDIEQLGGSMETAGIVAGTVLLPAMRDLTKTATRVVNASIPLIEAYGPDLIANLGKIAGFIADNLVPALYAAAAASAAYGISLLPLGTSLTTLIPLLYAKGAALTASLGPLALVAGAIFVITKQIQKFDDIYSDGTNTLLESRSWWNDSAKAIDAFQLSAASSSKAVGPLAASLRELRATQEAEITSLAKRQAQGVVTTDQWNAEMKVINARAEAIQGATDDLTLAIQATDAATYAAERETSALDYASDAYVGYVGYVGSATTAMQAAGETTKATAEEIADANKILLEVQSKGADALRDVVTANLSFQSDVEAAASEHWATLAKLHKEWADATTKDQKAAIQERIDAENTGYATSQQNAAAAYATEQAANRAHLGQLLIDTVNAWQTLGKVPADMAESLRSGIAEHFGVAGDSMSLQFGRFLGVIQGVADGTGVAVADMGTAFGALEQSAVTSAGNTAKSQELMIANIQAAYNEGKLTWEEYTTALANVPAEVNTLVTSNVPEQVTYWQQLGEKQGAISPITPAAIDSNVVDARERFIDFKLAQADIKADVPAMVSDNADEVRGRYLILSAKRAAMALEKPAVNVSTNAPTVTTQIEGIGTAVRNLPDSKTIHIRADIDPMLVQHSPSPIENVMAAIEEFTRQRHVLNLAVRGDAVDLFGGYADMQPLTRRSFFTQTSIVDDWVAGLREIRDALAETARATRAPSDELQARLDAIAGSADRLGDARFDDAFARINAQIERGTDTIVGGLEDLARQAREARAEVETTLSGGYASDPMPLRYLPSQSDDGEYTAKAAETGREAAQQFGTGWQQIIDTFQADETAQFGVWGDQLAARLAHEFAANSDLTEYAYNKGLYARDALLQGFGHPILHASIVIDGPGGGGGGDGRDGFFDLSIPGFAKGVTDWAGGLAYVHAGELLVNLPRGTSVLPAAGSGMVSPPASGQQIMRQAASSTTNSFTWSGNMIMPPGTTQQQGDALLDYIARRGG